MPLRIILGFLVMEMACSYCSAGSNGEEFVTRGMRRFKEKKENL